jgi:hypothetical protein
LESGQIIDVVVDDDEKVIALVVLGHVGGCEGLRHVCGPRDWEVGWREKEEEEKVVVVVKRKRKHN